jgi:uncharacterized repeat protein (TIGR01451 family)
VVGPVVVDDDKVEVDCGKVNEVGNLDDNLDPGEVLECTSSYTVTRADAQAGSVTNKATAYMGSTSSNEAVLTVDTETTPVLLLGKSEVLDSTFAEGETITYSFEAANKGNIDLTNVAISDDLPGLGELSCVPARSVDVLAIDDTINCDASYTITAADVQDGSVSNTATATSDETGTVDSNTVTLPAP